MSSSQAFFPQGISIHAPRTGSDDQDGGRSAVYSDFNPRSPHGERPTTEAGTLGCIFISIHAPRTGSDVRRGRQRRRRVAISIHAPRTGSDEIDRMDMPGFLNFNPRSPHGERLRSGLRDAIDKLFQSTLPARGATELFGGHAGNRRISIHAPRTGSDVTTSPRMCAARVFQSTLPARGATWTRWAAYSTAGNFNPRSPHGERRPSIDCSVWL